MDHHFLTERISSIEEFSRSLEHVIPGSRVEATAMSDDFESIGDGVLSNGLFLGKNLTRFIDEIDVRGSQSCILSIPSRGYYLTRKSQRDFATCTPETGALFLPTDSIQYRTEIAEVEDLIIVVGYDQVAPLLVRNYHITNVDQDAFVLDGCDEKIEAIQGLILNTLRLIRSSPHLTDSIGFKSSINELARLLMSEVIAYSLGVDFKSIKTPLPEIVKKAEDIMDAHPENFYSIREIADKVFTSPRNLQYAFKRYRNYSPMQFLRERKLYKARSILVNPDADTRIKQVASDCGFIHLSNFSNYYRQLFGELPSTTLKKSL